jgi:hypothetical protein
MAGFSTKVIRGIFFILLSISVFRPLPVMGYGLFTHEMIVNATWDKSILPLLKQKYPSASDTDLKEAREYAYGGTIIPDIGYYMPGNLFFTDLIHYVRNGDFIQSLLEESQNVDEYAFALGVLCHYTADTYGHSTGTNHAVPFLFPKEEKKYGDIITYEEARIDHIRVEYSFDVLQAGTGNYIPQAYHDFIAFKISQPVLERAFNKTYALDLKNYFNPSSIGFLRYFIKHLYEELSEDAWRLKKTDIIKANPLITEKTYRYRMEKKDYYKEFGKPKFKSVFVYAIIKIMPKIGPLLILKYKAPTPEVEKLYDESLNMVLLNFSGSLKEITKGNTAVIDKNCDTGNETLPGQYGLTDKCYDRLVLALANNKFEQLNPDLKNNILQFYSDPDKIKFPKQNSKRSKKLLVALDEIKVAGTE